MKRLDDRKTPLYDVVGAAIRKRLIENVWKPGVMLPSEMLLATELQVSQGTARKAIDGLVAEGLLVRRHGVGTFVSELTDRRELYLYFNFINRNGEREMPESRSLLMGIYAATSREAERLHLAPGAAVVRMKRLRLLSRRPVIVELIVLPEALFKGFVGNGAPPEHLFRHYENRYGVTVTHATGSIGAVGATKSDAKLLGVEPGMPLLSIDRIAFGLDGSAVEWRYSLCNTSEHRYEVRQGSGLAGP